MLRSLQNLYDYQINATDGSVGWIKDFLFDDQKWELRFLIASPWLFGQDVLLAIRTIGPLDRHNQTLPIRLTMKQIIESPDIHSQIPASQRDILEQTPYHEWPSYWTGFDTLLAEHPALTLPVKTQPAETPAEGHAPGEGNHLQSARDTQGLHIAAIDGGIGHLEDFIVNVENWRIRYLVVATKNWLPGSKVLISPKWIRSINWTEEKIHIDHTVQEVRNSPPFDPAEPINRAYEQVLYDYYGRPHYWTKDLV